MSTEIATRAASLTEKIAYSDNLACSDILPKQFQKKPANVLWAIEYGETLGITTMAALTGIHVIEGKPGASAALIGGLVRRAGHKLRVTGNNRQATAQIIRADDPDYTFEVTWELHRNERGNPNAEEAGVLGKQVWKNYPAAMLKARAITQVARDACEEILFGLHYTPEELGAEVDAEGEPIEQRAQRQYGQTADDPWQTQAPAAPATPAPVQEAEYAEVVGEDAGATTEWNTATGQPLPPPAESMPTITPEQLGQLAQLLKQKRGAVNGDRNRIISELVCRPVQNVQTLSQAEARSIIETLTAEPDRTPPAADAAPAGPAPVGTPDNPAITAAQQKALHAVLRKAGYGDRAKGLELLGRYVGRTLESSDHLSKTEASSIIDKLSNGELPPPAAPAPGPDAIGEGISEFDALDQMILDVHDQQSQMDCEDAIAAELNRGTITEMGAGVLRERLAAHVEQATAGASR